MLILYKHPDGYICEQFGAPKADIEAYLGTALTDQEYTDRQMACVPVSATSIITKDIGFVAGDNTFRSAWSDLNPDGTAIIDMVKAKQCISDNLVSNIQPLLNKKAVTDVAYGSNSSQSLAIQTLLDSISANMQTLNGITVSGVDDAATLATLKGLIVDCSSVLN